MLFINTLKNLLHRTHVIENYSGGFNQPNRTTVETVVYEHEFGHILGLVRVGTPLQSSHKDTASSGHCNVADLRANGGR